MKKHDFKSKIVSNKKIAENFYRMELESKGILFSAGEFFQISVPTHILRRPFAPSYSDSEKFAYTYQIVGEGTEMLSKLAEGTELSVIAPLGNGFTMPEDNSTAILVGGGCGTPSLALLATQLSKKNVIIYSIIGSRSSCTVLEKARLAKYSKKVVVTTDDGSEGLKGNSVNGVESILKEAKCNSSTINIFSCGPAPMLKSLTQLANRENINTELSFEERMACGFGACMGCVIKINSKNTEEGFVYKRVCHDGPVFNSKEIYWQ